MCIFRLEDIPQIFIEIEHGISTLIVGGERAHRPGIKCVHQKAPSLCVKIMKI